MPHRSVSDTFIPHDDAAAKDLWGFTPAADCDNCDGTGIFAYYDDDAGKEVPEPCIFCLDDAIRRGEIDGSIDNVDYVDGVQQPPAS